MLIFRVTDGADNVMQVVQLQAVLHMTFRCAKDIIIDFVENTASTYSSACDMCEKDRNCASWPSYILRGGGSSCL